MMAAGTEHPADLRVDFHERLNNFWEGGAEWRVAECTVDNKSRFGLFIRGAGSATSPMLSSMQSDGVGRPISRSQRELRQCV